LEIVMSKVRLVVASTGLLLFFATMSRAGDNGAEIKAVLDKATKAMGEPAKVAKLQTAAWKAKLSLNKGGTNVVFNLDASSRGWDHLRLEIDANINGMQKNAVLVIKGDKAWAKDEGNVKELPAKEFDVFRDIYFAGRAAQLLPLLKDKEFKVSHLGELNIKDQPAVGLRISRKNRPDVSLFFHKKTNLPLKADLRLMSPQGQEVEVEMFIGEYKEFDGLKHFSKVTFKSSGEEVVMEVSDIQPREQLDAALFNRPE
jgi:hypothetical protein